MTNAEIFAKLSAHYLKEIRLYEQALTAHEAEGRAARAENCKSRLGILRAKLAEAEAKYKH